MPKQPEKNSGASEGPYDATPGCGALLDFARPFSSACDIAARISRRSGASTASGWSVRSSTATAFLPRRRRVTRSAGNGRNMRTFSTPTRTPFSRRWSAAASAFGTTEPCPAITYSASSSRYPDARS